MIGYTCLDTDTIAHSMILLNTMTSWLKSLENGLTDVCSLLIVMEKNLGSLQVLLFVCRLVCLVASFLTCLFVCSFL